VGDDGGGKLQKKVRVFTSLLVKELLFESYQRRGRRKKTVREKM